MSNILIKDGKVVGGLPITVENMTLLWENPDPTSAFGSQTITLSSGDYDFCLAIMKNNVSSQNELSVIFAKGYNGYANSNATSSSNNVAVWSRSIQYTDDTHFNITDCSFQQNGSARTTDNSYLIPVAIYGIKKNGVANNVSTKASDCYLNNGKSVEEVIGGEFVSVTADGVKTVSALLNELYALIDFTKINPTSCYVVESSSNYVFQIVRYTANTAEFTSDEIASATTEYTRAVKIASSSAYYLSSNGTISDISSSVQPVGDTLRVYY